MLLTSGPFVRWSCWLISSINHNKAYRIAGNSRILEYGVGNQQKKKKVVDAFLNKGDCNNYQLSFPWKYS